MKKIHKAWAINTQSNEGHCFLGKFYFGYNIPKQLDGYLIAIFKTRDDAREAKKSIGTSTYNPFPKAKVSRVKITIEEI